MLWRTLGAVFCVACVPAARFEAVQSALAYEQNVHQQTLAQARAVEQDLAAKLAQGAEAARLSDIERGALEQRVAELELERSGYLAERSGATELVEQLQTELERASNHVRAYADRSAELDHALEVARQQANRLADLERETADRASLVRDLSLAFEDLVRGGEVEVGSSAGRPILRVPVTRLWGVDGQELDPSGRPLLTALASVALRHRDGSVVVTQGGEPYDTESFEASLTTMLGRVRAELVAAGVAESRVQVELPDAPSPPVTDAPVTPSYVEFGFVLPAPQTESVTPVATALAQ